MKTYEVKVPIAGHLTVSVQADSEEEAIEKAVDSGTMADLDCWEALKQFNQGNICHCPQPWEAEILDSYDED
jgi:hypothetical protein